MANHNTPRQTIIPKETLSIYRKKAANDDKGKSTAMTGKKVGGLGRRKALNDITNRLNLKPEVTAAPSSRKKIVPKNEFNIAEEMFLHDHGKCIKAHQTACEASFLDTVLPMHDAVFPSKNPATKQVKVDIDGINCCCPEQIELPASEISDDDWLKFLDLPQCSSPQSSSKNCFSPLGSPSPYPWKVKHVELALKPDSKNDG